MAPHSSTLAWKIPWMEESGRLQSMRLLRVRHDWATSLSLFTFMHWRRKWQPTPVFLPGESQGWGSLVGCRLWGHTESDMNEVTSSNPPAVHGTIWWKASEWETVAEAAPCPPKPILSFIFFGYAGSSLRCRGSLLQLTGLSSCSTSA